MQCPKCGSNNYEIVPITKGKIKKRGIFMTLVHLLLIIGTGGLWIIIPILTGGSKGKIKTKTIGICRDCGNKFKIK